MVAYVLSLSGCILSLSGCILSLSGCILSLLVHVEHGWMPELFSLHSYYFWKVYLKLNSFGIPVPVGQVGSVATTTTFSPLASLLLTTHYPPTFHASIARVIEIRSCKNICFR